MTGVARRRHFRRKVGIGPTIDLGVVTSQGGTLAVWLGDKDDAVTLNLSTMYTSPLTTIGAFIERNLLTISSRSEKMKLRDNGGGGGEETRKPP